MLRQFVPGMSVCGTQFQANEAAIYEAYANNQGIWTAQISTTATGPTQTAYAC